MSFVSFEFLFFIIISLLAYYLLPKKVQWIVLLVVSYLFFLSGGLRTISYLLFTTTVTYFTARYLSYCNELNNIAQERGYKLLSRKLKIEKRQIISLGIVANFAVLFFLKYYQYILGSIDEIMNSDKFSAVNIILPIGISFYMFQSIGYVIDVYRDKYKAERNFAKFALFVSFFPQVIQGPISRFGDLANQLFSENNFSFDKMKDGLQLVMWGYLKKLLIADRLIVVVNAVFNNYTSYGGAIILIGVILYCIQLYCDFSGSVDVARGLAKLFGIDVIQNFRRPIFATSLVDFWNRWNTSLSNWFKDYLFYPIILSKSFMKLRRLTQKYIGKKIGGIVSAVIVSFIVSFTMMIWYGKGFNGIVFALYNAIIIALTLLLKPTFDTFRREARINGKVIYILQIITTIIIVVIGRYMIGSNDISQMCEMLKLTFTKINMQELVNGTLFTLGMSVKDFIIVIAAILVIFVVEIFDEFSKNLKDILNNSHFLIQILIILVYMLIILFFGLCRI